MDRNPPATCTVELSTGAFVHLNHEPLDVVNARYEAEVDEANANALQEFKRVTNSSVTRWEQVWLDVTQIVAVYPLYGRPEPPMLYSVLTAGGIVPQGA
jgi:hypothetical protein